jgi:hypothetical protein
METRTIKKQLREIEEELKRETLKLCGELGIRNRILRNFEHKTINLCMLEIRTEGGRVYRYPVGKTSSLGEEVGGRLKD